MPPTPQPADDSHQLLLDQMDISHLTKPFRNPNWKPSQRRNKNIKQILSEAQRKEASVLATQNNSGASTPFPASGAASDGTLTPAQGISKPTNMAQATQSLSTLVLERNLQKAAAGSTNGSALGAAIAGLGPAVTYTNIESAPSLHPAHQKHYCDITGLPARYTDPKTRLRYHNAEIFGVRLKGAIDNRIAEEQARQRQAQQAAQGRPPARRRPQTPSATPQRSSARPRDGTSTPGEKQPDPSDFVIGDDEDVSTPAVEKPDPLTKTDTTEVKKNETPSEQQPPKAEESRDNVDVKTADANGTEEPSERPIDLPVEVRTKIRKLEKLEIRYPELLKAYRAAHARVQLIEPFEASLRENTPLTSIGDPAALVEYLNQVKLKGDMVLDELKRVSLERDEFKKKFEQSEKDATTLRAEVEELKQGPEMLPEPAFNAPGDEELVQGAVETRAADAETKEVNNTDAATKSPPSSRMGSFSLFSPRFGANKEAIRDKDKDASEDLFSYDSEVPRLEQELEQRTEEAANLTRQITSLKADLAVARESTSSMVQTLETATRELNILRDEKDKFESAKAKSGNRISELEATADSHTAQINSLEKQINDLQSQKITANTEIQRLKEQINDVQKVKTDIEAKLETQTTENQIINERLSQKDGVVKDLEDSLAAARLTEREQAKKPEPDVTSEKKLSTMQGVMNTLRTQLSQADTTIAELKKEIQAKQDEYANKPSTKVFGLLDEQKDANLKDLKTEDDAIEYLARNYGLRKESTPSKAPLNSAPSTTTTPLETGNGNAGGKKKNKKKKKAGKGQQNTTEEAEPDIPVKVSEDLNEMGEDDLPPTSSADASISALKQEVTELKEQVEQKVAIIDRLTQKLKDQEALQEEIETLRDDLLHQGEEHVEARDALKKAQEARKILEKTMEDLKENLERAEKDAAAKAEAEKANTELINLSEELKSKSEVLQKDFSAAESLAASRFKDITDLKEVLSKAQPELRQLRSEVAELKSAKDDLKNKEGELRRLENRHEDLKSELKGLGKRLGDKDSEIKELQTKIEQETKARNKVENDLASAQLDSRVADNKRKDTSELLEQRQKDLTQSKEEAASLRRKVRELEDKASEYTKEISSLKEEVTLKTALHSSSQSLLQSLRDQTHELSMQARESSSRAESLDEELAEAQRMLLERTRESQTMRMLLDQAQNGVEVRIREMKERMETAIEERDRVEDEANVRDRRLMREVEDARNKMRDAQRQLKGAEDERDELETKSRDWRRRREELEQRAQDAKKDVEDVKQAMKELRDALDESERQIREVEMQKSDLRRQVEETTERLEKLTRANKNLSEEIKKVQDGATRKGSLRPVGGSAGDSGVRSSRTSIDSTRSPAPTPARESASTIGPETSSGTKNAGGNVGLSQGTVDYVYLKNVLLQFMEQKNPTHQRQLVPVLGMLLHFDRKDEQKWMAAISSKS